jgi:quinol monooxygenase YgiN
MSQDQRVGVIARYPVAPGRRDEVLEAFRIYAEESLAEGSGVAEVFAVNADSEDPDIIWFYEVYADRDSYEAHFHTVARRRVHDRLDGLRGGEIVVTQVEPITLALRGSAFAGGSASRDGWNSVTEEVT